MSFRPQADDQTTTMKLRQAFAETNSDEIEHSRARLKAWFESNSPELYWSQLDTALGLLYLACNQTGLVRISFAQTEVEFLAELDPKAQLIAEGDEIHPYRQQLEEYFAGRRRSFSLPTDLAGLTEFQREVLMVIDEIPAGRVRSYGEIATQINRPGAARAVGQALGRNPIPIVLPCHRVVASDGSLGGYAGGLDRKRRLLSLEGALPLR